MLTNVSYRILTCKVVIGTESQSKLNYAKKHTDELGAEDNNMADVKEATKKLIELAGNNKYLKVCNEMSKIKQYSAH